MQLLKLPDRGSNNNFLRNTKTIDRQIYFFVLWSYDTCALNSELTLARVAAAEHLIAKWRKNENEDENEFFWTLNILCFLKSYLDLLFVVAR